VVDGGIELRPSQRQLRKRREVRRFSHVDETSGGQGDGWEYVAV
jgi:hypothetical protein